MNDLAAVIGMAQMKRWKYMQSRRMEIVKRYHKGLKDFPYIAVQQESPYAKNGWPVLPIMVTEGFDN
jgi:dTDP-4-amino-4,6-dideoxygalactose transaminase